MVASSLPYILFLKKYLHTIWSKIQSRCVFLIWFWLFMLFYPAQGSHTSCISCILEDFALYPILKKKKNIIWSKIQNRCIFLIWFWLFMLFYPAQGSHTSCIFLYLVDLASIVLFFRYIAYQNKICLFYSLKNVLLIEKTINNLF